MPIPKLLITAGLMAANMALTMSRKIEGPRLDDLKFTSGDYGSPLPIVWGTRRMQCPIFWSEDLKEVKRRRKTKGGKYNEYTYYGTWAVALAGHEIEAVTRVWFDTHLVFDMTGAGPVTPFDFGEGGGRFKEAMQNINEHRGKAGNQWFAIYTGTETQEADPRMQATVEAKHGEGSCPAYRGTAYIVFKDVPLEKLGNRIPQVSVEFVGQGATGSLPYETHDTTIDPPANLYSLAFATDYSRFVWVEYGGEGFEIWDAAARAQLVSGTLPFTANAGETIGMSASGAFYVLDNGFTTQNLYRVAADGGGAAAYFTTASSSERQQTVRVVENAYGQEFILTTPWSTNTTFFVGSTPMEMVDLTGVAWSPTGWFADARGGVWGVGRVQNVGVTTAYLYRISGEGTAPEFIMLTGLPAHTAPLYYVHGCAAGENILVMWHYSTSAYFMLVSLADGSVVSTATIPDIGLLTAPGQMANLSPAASSIWFGSSTSMKEISLTDLSVIRTVTLSDWLSGDSDIVVYDPTTHALICADQAEKHLTWRYLDRVGSDGVTLESIASGLADQVGVSDYDFSDLDQLIPGWSATQGQASAMLEPLLDAYDSDIRPHGFTIEGVKRTGVSGGSLFTERFVGSPRYSVKVRQAAELPRALTVSFADVDGDQQANNARADRPLDATGARGEKTLELTTLALDADTARGLADRYFRRMWNERKEIALGLTAQQLALEPADVRTLDLDGETVRARLVKLTIKADDTLATEWRYDSPSLALLTSATGANFDGRNPAVIAVPLVSKGFVLDIPLLRDADSVTTPVVYLAAAPFASGTWPGASFFQAVDGEYSDEIASVASSSQAAWGYTTDVLDDANPNVWDRGNSVNVKLQVGTLAGTTEASINAAPSTNLALIGDELVNFTTATLETDGSYTLSGFKRGRRGTEWATADHAVRDVFLLLDTAETEAMGLSEVGTNLSFKAITSGRSESSAFPIALEPFTGASLKPYAPCHLSAALDSGTGDFALSWVRRTRVGGAWTSGTSIPLAEASEEYEVEIMDGATVKRTVTGLTSPSYTYSSASQVADFGAPQTSISFRVYQVSDAVGRGFVAEY